MMEEANADSSLNESAISTGAENSQDSQEEADAGSQGEHEQREKLVQLPLGRVRNIVRTDPDVKLVNSQAIFLITKSAELFIDSLAKEAYKYTAMTKKKTVQKRDLESAIDDVDALDFLAGMLD